MLTVKLYRNTSPDRSGRETIEIVEATQVHIHKGPGEDFFYLLAKPEHGDWLTFDVVRDGRAPDPPPHVLIDKLLYYQAYVENAKGSTVHALKFE